MISGQVRIVMIIAVKTNSYICPLNNGPEWISLQSMPVRYPIGSARPAAVFLPALMVSLSACTTAFNPARDLEEMKPVTIMEAPSPEVRQGRYDPEQVNHGKYLVELLGCGSCHTDGALVGKPVPGRYLAGSRTGIAYTSPLEDRHPGIVYPSNLTPDPETGLGKWNDTEIIDMIRTGTDRHGRRQLPVMPWPAYARVSQGDARAIVAYLRNLPSVRHRVPENVSPGNRASQPFVYFGVYQSRRR